MTEQDFNKNKDVRLSVKLQKETYHNRVNEKWDMQIKGSK